jgi:phenylpyruvate tautomerase PptA (4-oxalocrotonate tautomerase family)
VSLFRGKTQRDKDRLAESMTESVCKIWSVDKKEVTVDFRKRQAVTGMLKVNVCKLF